MNDRLTDKERIELVASELSALIEEHVGTIRSRRVQRAARSAIARLLEEGRQQDAIRPEDVWGLRARIQQLPKGGARRHYTSLMMERTSAVAVRGRVSLALAVELRLDPVELSPDRLVLRAYMRLRKNHASCTAMYALARFGAARGIGPLEVTPDELAEFFAGWSKLPKYVYQHVRAFYRAQFLLGRVGAEVALEAGSVPLELCRERVALTAFLDGEGRTRYRHVIEHMAKFCLVRYGRGPLAVDRGAIRSIYAECVDVLSPRERTIHACAIRDLYVWAVSRDAVEPGVAEEAAWLTAPERVVRAEGLTVDPDCRRAWWRGSQIALGRAEAPALAYLARHAGQAVTRAAVSASGLSGREGDPDGLIRQLRVKLGDESRHARILVTVPGGVKLRLPAQPQPGEPGDATGDHARRVVLADHDPSAGDAQLRFGKLTLDTDLGELAFRGARRRLRPAETQQLAALMRAAGRTVAGTGSEQRHRPHIDATVREVTREQVRVQRLTGIGTRLVADDGRTRFWGLELGPRRDVLLIEGRPHQLWPSAVRTVATLLAGHGLPVSARQLIDARRGWRRDEPRVLREVVYAINRELGFALIVPVGPLGYRLAVEAINPGLRTLDVLMLQPSTGQVTIADRAIDLTLQEAATLAFLLDRQGEFVTEEGLLATLTGRGEPPRRAPVASLRRKLGRWPDGTEVVVTLPGNRHCLLSPSRPRLG